MCYRLLTALCLQPVGHALTAALTAPPCRASLPPSRDVSELIRDLAMILAQWKLRVSRGRREGSAVNPRQGQPLVIATRLLTGETNSTKKMIIIKNHSCTLSVWPPARRPLAKSDGALHCSIANLEREMDALRSELRHVIKSPPNLLQVEVLERRVQELASAIDRCVATSLSRATCTIPAPPTRSTFCVLSDGLAMLYAACPHGLSSLPWSSLQKPPGSSHGAQRLLGRRP